MILIRSIPFLFHEAFLNIRRHGLATLAVVSTVAVALCILCAFGLIGWQFHVVTDRLPRQFEAHAFLDRRLEPEEVEQIRDEVQAMPGIKSVRLVTRQQAWAKYKGEYAGPKSDLEGMDENPLPDKLEVQAVSPEQTLGISARIRGIPGVERVLDGAEVLRSLIAIHRFVRTGTLVLAALLALGLTAIISNSIRITLFARRREIRVMQLVGATNAFVRLPFLLEGIFDGLAGAAIAGGLMYAAYRYLNREVLPNLAFAGEFRFSLNVPICLGAIVACGAVLGLFGSSVSVRRFLRI
jgi:cell division transport system permease protein